MAVAVRDREATASIRAIAERQHGVVAAWQMVGAGLSEDTILSRRYGGLLLPVFQGVYVLGDWGRALESRRMAAVLACGPGAVLSHFSAGAHWGICGSYGPIEVLRQSGGFHPKGHRGVKLHQTRRLESYEVAVQGGIPVATMEQVLLDLAARTGMQRLERAFVQA